MNKKGQVWIETVIYTLIGLVLIGIVLAFATPVVEKQKDKATIEKSVESLNNIDNVIVTVKRAGIANSREVNFLMGRGNLEIDGENEKIIFTYAESSYPYSEPGITIDVSGTNLRAETKNKGKKYDITLTLDYNASANITYNKQDIKKVFERSPNPYNLFIENNGRIYNLSAPVECTSIPVDSCLGPYSCTDGHCKPDYTNINIYESS